MRSEVAVASFEPGILDSYVGEDKFHEVLAYMDSPAWYLGRLDVRGARRLDPRQESRFPRIGRRVYMAGLAPAPGWVEAWFIRNYTADDAPSPRALLMAWIGATRLKQYGHAWVMARLGRDLYGDSLFRDCETASERILLLPNMATIRRLWAARTRLQEAISKVRP